MCVRVFVFVLFFVVVGGCWFFCLFVVGCLFGVVVFFWGGCGPNAVPEVREHYSEEWRSQTKAYDRSKALLQSVCKTSIKEQTEQKKAKRLFLL